MLVRVDFLINFTILFSASINNDITPPIENMFHALRNAIMIKTAL